MSGGARAVLLRKAPCLPGTVATIRLAVPADFPAIAEVERAASRLFAGTHMDWAVNAPPTDPSWLAAAWGRGWLWVAVAAADGRVVGFLMATPLAQDLFVQELSVHPDLHRRGIGTALLAQAAAAARKAGCAGMALTTDRTLPWNAPFYARLGFVLQERPAPALRERLAAERRAGMDPRQRCAMRLDLRDVPPDGNRASF
ncbi:GNAT family N-acetyltransferase [Geminicoccus harenae]|uniref:GNAT family N-acetyltransferase n=1 Tax=Geminicoccus harenae TaxID=2498453 RepID=UPI001C98903F|nr:GNAT family N-acetyltransferase [Geminicoccus harenae]